MVFKCVKVGEECQVSEGLPPATSCSDQVNKSSYKTQISANGVSVLNKNIYVMGPHPPTSL